MSIVTIPCRLAESATRPPIMQGLFVPFARVGSGDPVRVLHLFHNKYSGYCCIHLLCKAMYNLSLPRLSANYHGLPTTVQLQAAHESRCSLFGVSRSTAQVLYCTCLERYIYGTVQSHKGSMIGIQCQLVICRGHIRASQGTFQIFLRLTVLWQINF